METVVMATTGPREGESEPVIVNTNREGAVVFDLDDGRVLAFDRVELLAALEVGAPAAEAVRRISLIEPVMPVDAKGASLEAAQRLRQAVDIARDACWAH
jgi:hypothetical protein